jgi:hypothetical protein
MKTGRRINLLALAAVVFGLTILFHGADHIRRGTGPLTPEVYWGGAVLALVNFTVIGFVLRRHPRAPLLCAFVGLWTAAGVSAAHLAPHWSAFSDPYPDQSLDALAWVAMLSEVVAALVLAAVAIAALRRDASPNLAQA